MNVAKKKSKKKIDDLKILYETKNIHNPIIEDINDLEASEFTHHFWFSKNQFHQ